MTIYWVETGHGGSDSGTEADPFLTIDQAMNAVAAGDKVWVKASGTYSETPDIDTLATVADPITFEGYLAITGDEGKVTVSGTTNCLTDSAGGSLYYIFKNLIFSGASSNGVNLGSDSCIWYNCEFNNNGNVGCDVGNTHMLINCVIHNNGDRGVNAGAQATFVGCIAYANTGEQLYGSNTYTVYKNVCYAGTGSSDMIRISANGGSCFIANTIDGEGGADVLCAGGTGNNGQVVVDNIFYDGTTAYEQVIDRFGFAGYNLMNSVTNKYYSGSEEWPNWTGDRDVTDPPSFSDEANDDYTLSPNSPAINAGLEPGGIT